MAGEVVEQGRVAQFVDAAREHAREAAAGAAVVLAGVAIAACGGAGKTEKVDYTRGVAAHFNGDPKLCDGLQVNGNQAFVRFPSGNFLPAARGAVGSPKEATTYVQSFFDADGPLAQKVDIHSLAAVDAAFVAEAQSPDTNNDYSIIAQYNQDIAKLSDPATAQEAAVSLCKSAVIVMGETASFSEQAISAGEEYFTLTAIDQNGTITGARLDQHTGPGKPLAGVVFEATADTHGFSKVALLPDGRLAIPGKVPTGGAKETTNLPQPVGNQVSTSQNPAGSLPNTQRVPVGGGESTQSNLATGNSTQPNRGGGGSGTSHAGSGKGKPTGPGQTPQSQPGTATGNSNGNQAVPNGAPQEGTGNGNEATPSGGPGTGNGNTTGNNTGNGTGNTGTGNGTGNTGTGSGTGNGTGNNGGGEGTKGSAPSTGPGQTQCSEYAPC